MIGRSETGGEVRRRGFVDRLTMSRAPHTLPFHVAPFANRRFGCFVLEQRARSKLSSSRGEGPCLVREGSTREHTQGGLKLSDISL